MITANHFTKFATGSALAEKQAKGVISALSERAFFVHGAPRAAPTGNGREFKMP